MAGKRIIFEKEWEKDSASYSPLFILAILQERNKIIFDNEDFSHRRMRSSFVHSLHSWARLFVNSASLFVSNLVLYGLEQISLFWGWWVFSLFLVNFYFLHRPCGTLCILPVYVLACLFGSWCFLTPFPLCLKRKSFLMLVSD